jgi:hypothetical protein
VKLPRSHQVRSVVRTYWSIGFIFLIAAVFVWATVTSKPFQQCVSREQQAESAADNHNIPSLFIPLGIYRTCTGRFVIHENAGITALATLIIAIFTVVLVEVSNRQARMTQEALIYDKRASIFPMTFDQQFNKDAATGLYEWRLRPLWRNIGATPALQTIQYSSCEIRNSLLPDGFDFAYNPNDVGKGYFPPQSELFGGYSPKQTQAAITAHDIVDSQNNRKFIYLWGFMKYSSVFPNTPKYRSHFCWLITAVGDPLTFVPNSPGAPPAPGVLRFFLAQHKEGNTLTEEWD